MFTDFSVAPILVDGLYGAVAGGGVDQEGYAFLRTAGEPRVVNPTGDAPDAPLLADDDFVEGDGAVAILPGVRGRGRGLFIVEAVAECWGVADRAFGKAVWADVAR